MRTPSYERSQVMWPLWVVLACVALLAGVLARQAPEGRALGHVLIGVAAPLLALLIFGRLQVRIDSQLLEWRFGFLGWPRWRVPLADIASLDVVRTTWTDGWGIHRGKDGWTYNASGFGAVRITRIDGRTFRLGSDEPARLAAFIRERMTRRG
jgi:hypothetical protein